jgi:hypothetical protein
MIICAENSFFDYPWPYEWNYTPKKLAFNCNENARLLRSWTALCDVNTSPTNLF